ncbi:RNA polymerase sigma-70 factor (ECF subfamily) [Lewinella aquimaris]|uniref:RNA polymerase sigma-70 factor (ECF subfamily) n=1 Tax=Neolewinella aquimaris TaxID=1835722 RepID=A0A840E144_9BACT|nr:sigma-70 family RNA polymerase sigma factor [Neolewinella aquimaris]MBB4077445.1 RNA polymerase sigma-70 factor (ECF subfamily) [Neolewinella aquimaris]
MSRNAREHLYESELLVHYPVVYNFLLRMTAQESDAADLTQETFVRAYLKIDHYEAGTNGRAWLFCLARNLFINDYRKRKRRGEQELDERAAYQYRDVDSPMAGFADLRIAGALDRDFSDQIMKAMTFLSDRQRAIVLMADLYDFAEKEIAEAMEMPLNTVKSVTRRSRIALIKQLQSYAESTFGIVNTRNLG